MTFDLMPEHIGCVRCTVKMHLKIQTDVQTDVSPNFKAEMRFSGSPVSGPEQGCGPRL